MHAMVDRVYGKLDEANYRRAIAKLPGGSPIQSHAGVTVNPQNHGGWHDDFEDVSAEFRRRLDDIDGEFGEGRRTRTFNQRIKSPMLYH